MSNTTPKYIDNLILKKLNDYFIGDNLSEDSFYTLVVFQKGLQQKTDAKEKQQVSVAYSFNHINYMVDRFLVNYGQPYNLEINPLAPENQFSVNHIINKGSFISKDIENINYYHQDGKFSKHFFTLFLLELIYNKFHHNEDNYKGITDMRVISEYRSQIRHLGEQDYSRRGFRHPYIINIPDSYYSKTIAKIMRERFFYRFELRPYNPIELSPALKDLRKVINGKTFVNNKLMEIKIEEMNKFFRNKAMNM